MSKPNVVVCLPAYNEEQNIAQIIEGVRKYSSEIIVCDDGSIDNTYDAAVAAGADVIRHTRNRGYGAAIRTLFEAAKDRNADVMVTIDSDGQHNVDQIPNLIQPILDQEADLVIGSRFLNKNDGDRVPLYRTIGIKTLTRFTSFVSYENLTDGQSGFRAYGKKAISSVQLSEKGMAVSAEILVRAKESNLRVREVPVTITYDVEDASTHNPLSHGLGVAVAIVKFVSIKHPLAFYGIPGLAFMVLAAVFAGDVLNFFATGNALPTNVLILTIGSALIGLVLIATGVVLYCLTEIKRTR